MACRVQTPPARHLSHTALGGLCNQSGIERKAIVGLYAARPPQTPNRPSMSPPEPPRPLPASCRCGEQQYRSNTHHEGGTNPVWNQKFVFKVGLPSEDLHSVPVQLRDNLRVAMPRSCRPCRPVPC